MYNLTKMYLYRLLRSLSTRVLLLLTIGFAIFSSVMTNYDLKLMADEIAADESGASDESGVSDEEDQDVVISVGIYTETDPRWVNGEIDFTDLFSTFLRSKLLLILIAVFISLFTAAEYRSGFIKNIAGQFPFRPVLTAARTIVSAVLVLVMFLVFGLSTAVCARVLWGDRLALGSIGELFQAVGLQYLLHTAFACLIAFLCQLANSSAFSITIGILMAGGVFIPLYSLADRAIRFLPENVFRFLRFMPDAAISVLRVNASGRELADALISAAAFLLVPTALAMLLTQKRDIR